MWPVTAYLQKLSAPITFIWIIGVTNAVNLIDGLDGLAAGVSSIASICLMVLCILTGTESAVMFTAALAGSCLGFYRETSILPKYLWAIQERRSSDMCLP